MSCRSGGSEGYVSYPVGSLPISVKGIRLASHNNNTPMSGAFTSFVPSFSRTANNPRLKLTGYRGQCISFPHPLPILYVELLILQGWSARGRLSECSGLPAHLSLDSPASRLLLIVRPPRIWNSHYSLLGFRSLPHWWTLGGHRRTRWEISINCPWNALDDVVVDHESVAILSFFAYSRWEIPLPPKWRRCRPQVRNDLFVLCLPHAAKLAHNNLTVR